MDLDLNNDVEGVAHVGDYDARQIKEEEEEDDGRKSAWSFGGMTLDGSDGGGVPICKHLLACLLAERWSAALGRYVVERRVGRDEMAGIVADV
ncbi:hypothetical protein B0T17DRAFT_514141 [Bombardia bombarda]|uniref:SWIM-type domain-containing protein n=1 Tax=Bombardia bombarda TaxID=252184 RepID=A0AA39XIN2_9PEZI|nr:hypothetical protein B0T17DRAFT_514141 [Bombardia bombarda]